MMNGLKIAAGVLGLTLVLPGCQQGITDPVPAPPATPVSVTAGMPGTGPDEFVAGIWDLILDPESLTAEVVMRHAGTSQPPQNLSFDLDIDQFLTRRSLFVSGIFNTSQGDLGVSLIHAHPFPTPNLAQPATALNRTDLSYTGRLLVIPSGMPTMYFENEVRLRPGVVLNPDGYVNPGDLLAMGNQLQLTNTHPYVLLVDELADSRILVSNQGVARGNYDPLLGGWQRANLGSNGNGWTGYDYLHAGQRSVMVVVLAKEAVETSVTFSLAVLIKYTDPRGAGGPGLRFPPEEVDVTQFAYRLPYAALDVSKVGMPANLSMGQLQNDELVVNLSVRDWDRAATEATGHALGALTDVSLIQQNASGLPTARFHMPDLFVGSLTLTPGGPATGEAGDELNYPLTLVNELVPPRGKYYGVAEFVDPEDPDTAAWQYRYGVDPDTLTANSSRALRRITYQVVPVQVGPVVLAPPVITGVTPSGINGVGTSLDTVTFTVTYENDGSIFAWYFPNGGVEDGIEQVRNGDPTLTVRLARPGVYQGFVQITGSGGKSAAWPFFFRVYYPGMAFTELTIDGSIDASHLAIAQSGVRAQAAVIDEVTSSLYYYRATRNVPTAPSDWVKVTVDAATALSAPQLVLHNDIPVLLYKRTTGTTRIAIASSATPSSASDFTFYSFPADVSLHSQLIVRGNRLMFAYRNVSLNRLEIARATALTPGPSDWIYYRPGYGDVDSEVAPCLMPGPYDSLWCVVREPGLATTMHALHTFVVSPREFSDWSKQVIFVASDEYRYGELMLTRFEQPRLALWRWVNGDSLLLATKNQFPAHPTEWWQVGVRTTSYDYQYPYLRRVGNRPVVGSGTKFPAFRPALLVSLTDEPIDEEDFTYTNVSSLNGDFGTIPVRTLTPDGSPRLLCLVANGENGFRQAVLNTPWH
ncbi:MAG: hypothetical protein GEEBNDBF_02221 [bacterium]|nr:hypothetical protein [bacterium]